MNTIATNLDKLQQQIDQSCLSCGRNPQEVALIAVSKKKPSTAIAEAFTAGQKLFGESYVQEFSQKSAELQIPIAWHFIGGLQSNKVKYLRGKTALIHSVDRYSLAREISQQWGKIDATAKILLQFNLGAEASKSGAAETEAYSLAAQITALPHIEVCGLMTLPPFCENIQEVRPYFKQLRLLGEKLNSAGLPNLRIDHLSMGMSHDFQIAIEEGATLVRIGTAIFGQRD